MRCKISFGGWTRTGEKFKRRLPILWRLLQIGNALSVRLFLFLSYVSSMEATIFFWLAIKSEKDRDVAKFLGRIVCRISFDRRLSATFASEES